MKALRRGTLAATIAICAFPPVAAAEYLVPPGNSAATQYTEALPTAGGHRDVDRRGKAEKRSPAEVLGRDNARRLEEQGAQGREAAEVAAATAPVLSATTSPDSDEGAGGVAGGGGRRDGGGGDAGRPGRPADRAATGSRGSSGGAGDVHGASGLREVLAQATGSSSSGQMGLLLPLLILGTVAWSLAYLWRGRKRPTA